MIDRSRQPRSGGRDESDSHTAWTKHWGKSPQVQGVLIDAASGVDPLPPTDPTEQNNSERREAKHCAHPILLYRFTESKGYERSKEDECTAEHLDGKSFTHHFEEPEVFPDGGELPGA